MSYPVVYFSVKEQIISLLTECRPAQAVKLLVKAQSNFPGTELELASSQDDDSM